jgi:transcriptional regulator with XRE-family HTH domain
MTKEIPIWIKIKVMQEWLLGCSRIKIAEDNDISESSVSRIIQGFKADIPDIDLLREIVLTLKKDRLTPFDFASSIRIRNKLKADNLKEKQIDDFIEMAKVFSFRKGLSEEGFMMTICEVMAISEHLGVPVAALEGYLYNKFDEKTN